VPVHFNDARVRLQKRADNVDGCGFARAVGSEKRENFALLDIEVDSLDRMYGAVGFLQAVYFNDVAQAAVPPDRLKVVCIVTYFA